MGRLHNERCRECGRNCFDEGWCRVHFKRYACHEYAKWTHHQNPNVAAAICGHCGQRYDVDYDEWAKCPVNLKASLTRAGVLKTTVPVLRQIGRQRP